MDIIRKSKTFFLLVLIACFAHSCTLHPPYYRPDVEIPDNWRITTDESSSYVNSWWWDQFHDPVLNSLINEALESNKDLKVAIVRVYDFFGQLLVANSGLYPQINGAAAALRQEASIALTPLPMGVKRTFNEYNCLLNASYDVDIWGKIRSGTEAAIARLLGSIEARRTVVLTVVTSVATAYIQLRQFDKQLDISKETYLSRKEAYDIALARYIGGITSELEVKQSEAELESAAADIVRFELIIEKQENLISVLLGHPSQSIERGLNLDELVLIPCIPSGIPSQVLNQRPDILLAEFELIAANADIGVAKANFFPDITLTANYGNASLELHKLLTAPARAWQFGGNVFQPIFTGGALAGELEIAEARKWEAYYAYEEVVLTAFQEVNDALASRKKNDELIRILQKEVAALDSALNLATLQYNNGQVDYLNVLDARRNLFVVQLNLAEAEGELFLSLINLYKALGGGWVNDADSQAIQETRCLSPERPLIVK